MAAKIGNDWDELLKDEWEKPYYKNLMAFLENERQTQTVYPPVSDLFNALRYTPYSDVKAVILGQDPYHQPGQAHGLCFSVKNGVRPPPSLLNVFRELQEDIASLPSPTLPPANEVCIPPHGAGVRAGRNGDLSDWAKNGVLLLNTVLTVRHGMANSHRNCGWEVFTDRILELLNKRSENHKKPLVFILWGRHAFKKAELLDNPHNLILIGTHPSPLSANRGGFFGGKYFTKTNAFLREHGIEEINWRQ